MEDRWTPGHKCPSLAKWGLGSQRAGVYSDSLLRANNRRDPRSRRASLRVRPHAAPCLAPLCPPPADPNVHAAASPRPSPTPRCPAADLLVCLMPPLRPPTFPPSPRLLRPRRLSSPPPSLALGARATERSDPRVHEQRETSGSLVASNLTQAHRAASGSPRPAGRERKGRGMPLPGWGEDARGTGAEAGDPRRCPAELGDPVRRRQGPSQWRDPRPGLCAETAGGSDRPVRDRVPKPETAGTAAALRKRAAPSGSKSIALTRLQ